MNRLIALAMLLFAVTMAAQTPRLPQNAASARDFAPNGWHVYFADKGDLNKDGISDLAFILQSDNSEGKRILGIAFGKKGGGYRLQVQNAGFLSFDEDLTDCFVDMSIKKGTLHFNFLLPFSPAFDDKDSFIFRFQNGRFELIGWQREHVDNAKDKVREATSVNFSTKTIIAEDRTKKSETRKKVFSYGRLKSFDEVTPGEFQMSYDDL